MFCRKRKLQKLSAYVFFLQVDEGYVNCTRPNFSLATVTCFDIITSWCCKCGSILRYFCSLNGKWSILWIALARKVRDSQQCCLLRRLWYWFHRTKTDLYIYTGCFTERRWTFIYIYIYIYIHTHTHIYIYIHTHIHTHTHTHTHTAVSFACR